MTTPFRVAFGLACLTAPFLGVGAAAEGKRPWVDPPADVDSRTGSAPAEASPKGKPEVSSREQADKPAVAAKEITSAKPVRAAKTKAAPGGGAVAQVRPNSRLGQAKAARPSDARPKTRLATRRAPTPGGRDARVSVAGRPLELMNLQTIELPDGRRFNVLTRPDRQMIEEFVSRP
jgi:hypothetical protein